MVALLVGDNRHFQLGRNGCGGGRRIYVGNDFVGGEARLVHHDGVVLVASRVHMIVKQRLPHESETTNEAFVRFLITVYKSVRVSVVPAIERFATNLQRVNKF